MTLYVDKPDRTSNSEKGSTSRFFEEMYEFPASVRLLHKPEFKDQLIGKLKNKLEQDPSSSAESYRLLVDIHRKAGDLELAAEYAQLWHNLASDQQALHLLNILKQRPIVDNISNTTDLKPAPFATFEHFLTKDEQAYFWQKAMTAECAFEKAGIGLNDEKIVDCNQRDTNVLFLDEKDTKFVRKKIRVIANELFKHFNMPLRKIKKIEVKMTTHGQGGFFKIHHDGFSEIKGSTRCLSWVYYFHAMPKKYEGGDLILFDSDANQEEHEFSPVRYTRYIPENNQIIFFPSWFYHGVTPVDLLTPGFSSGRFAIAGHIRCQ